MLWKPFCYDGQEWQKVAPYAELTVKKSQIVKSKSFNQLEPTLDSNIPNKTHIACP